ncbi:YigZ family protein [Shewanella sp. OMA3-2]|uniref:YigZ family protein n=1 Tax=Shewanella sp. OMA3-2 TaxID=2908650 RepID=UPI001F467587|nr:YigZ family protein [Shewanella sp. OMA3-2]UJF22237.1 YigZ family protein [Shewanella sp. OMA3-2]
MTESYSIPDSNLLIEEEIKHSRFISFLFHCPDQDVMKLTLTNMKQEYPGASHYCYAFIAGEPNEMVNIGSSDDGEPGGSAGRPMLASLQGANVGEIGAIVIRYFGGTKLGVGGLMRAYSSGIKQGISQLSLRTKYIRYPITLECSYAQLVDVEYLVALHDGVILAKAFSDKVDIRFELAKDALADFNTHLATMTQGTLQVKFTV